MNAPAHTPDLRHRESATADMIRQITEKIDKLDAARRDRAEALQRIRHELARALQAEPAAARHEHHN